mgnify:FL=1
MIDSNWNDMFAAPCLHKFLYYFQQKIAFLRNITFSSPVKKGSGTYEWEDMQENLKYEKLISLEDLESNPNFGSHEEDLSERRYIKVKNLILAKYYASISNRLIFSHFDYPDFKVDNINKLHKCLKPGTTDDPSDLAELICFEILPIDIPEPSVAEEEEKKKVDPYDNANIEGTQGAISTHTIYFNTGVIILTFVDDLRGMLWYNDDTAFEITGIDNDNKKKYEQLCDVFLHIKNNENLDNEQKQIKAIRQTIKYYFDSETSSTITSNQVQSNKQVTQKSNYANAQQARKDAEAARALAVNATSAAGEALIDATKAIRDNNVDAYNNAVRRAREAATEAQHAADRANAAAADADAAADAATGDDHAAAYYEASKAEEAAVLATEAAGQAAIRAEEAAASAPAGTGAGADAGAGTDTAGAADDSFSVDLDEDTANNIRAILKHEYLFEFTDTQIDNILGIGSAAPTGGVSEELLSSAAPPAGDTDVAAAGDDTATATATTNADAAAGAFDDLDENHDEDEGDEEHDEEHDEEDDVLIGDGFDGGSSSGVGGGVTTTTTGYIGIDIGSNPNVGYEGPGDHADEEHGEEHDAEDYRGDLTLTNDVTYNAGFDLDTFAFDDAGTNVAISDTDWGSLDYHGGDRAGATSDFDGGTAASGVTATPIEGSGDDGVTIDYSDSATAGVSHYDYTTADAGAEFDAGYADDTTGTDDFAVSLAFIAGGVGLDYSATASDYYDIATTATGADYDIATAATGDARVDRDPISMSITFKF